ncbi:neuroligin-4, Y-linked-like [Pieris brassicae]|uniref:neuroligin-4, Y-linked-like n=1 Tax=Pieris brassicae TaxID=7116 RepID=UPI001E6604EF|nr:neuroligin-4, Y-linked-like [Pieris brassicae]XP_045515696.1 neuroligin-4, Y-linked-like [Pieris brassicae]
MASQRLPLHLCNSIKQYLQKIQTKTNFRSSKLGLKLDWQSRIILVLLIVLLFSVTSSGNSFGRNSMLRTRIIGTRYGKLQGVILPMDQHKYLKPVEAYLGVPYATPPTGSNRFAPTRAPAPWDDVKTVDQMGPVCPQRLPDIDNETLALERMPKGRLEYLRRLLPRLKNQSEDCLYMNIYTPVQVGPTLLAKYPVVIFIHGEAFEWNSGNVYDGSVLASYAGLVVITINYRLGILGFLNANPIPHVRARVANYGLMDQIAALHWVQQNIALFGGDPGNVTMLGHGSGAACINFLMISPTVMPGLFHRVILLSGSALSSWALVEDPVNYSVQLAKQSNCTLPEDIVKDHELIVDCLREVPLQELMSAEISTPSYLTAFGPSVDGVVVKTDYAKELLTFFIPNDLQGFTSVSGVNNFKADKRSGDRIFGIRGGQNKYDLLFGVVTSEALWKFSAQDIQNGFEGERRDRIIRTYVRNAYTYHLSEIFFTIVNEYTDWERTVQHPINTRDAAVLALSDAQYVAPLVQTGDFLSVAKSSPDSGPNAFFYVFDYQTKDGDYPQRMGSVHGEELPYLFGAPLVDGLGHFPKNYTKSEVALSEAFILYVANFVRTGNPNEVQRQESVLPISRERNKYKSIVWDEYDTLHQKYLEIGMKPRMKNHYRAHQLSVWLRLIPEIHRAGMKDVITKHNLFRNHNDPEMYDGLVRADPLTRANYYDPTLELYRKSYNVTLDIPTTTMDTHVTTCISVMSARPGAPVTQSQPNNSQTQDVSNLEVASYTAYSTALSVTIAIGCSLLILNVLIFAGVYYQRDKTRLQVKALQQQKRNHNSTYDTSKHPHYFVGHSQSSSTIVDIDHQDKNAIIAMTNRVPHFTNTNCPNVCHTGIQMANLKTSPNRGQCTTLPRKVGFSYQNQICNASNCMTLPKNATFMSSGNLPDVQAQTGQSQTPGNGSIQPTSPQHFSQKSRVPQAAMSEMNV